MAQDLAKLLAHHTTIEGELLMRTISGSVMMLACCTTLASGAIQPGLNSRWVEVVAFSALNPHDIAGAKAVLALQPGDTDYVSEVNLMVMELDYADGPGLGGITPAFNPDPLTGVVGADPIFAVGYTGLIEIPVAGSYDFKMWHDDGFELMIDGALVFDFDADTAPIETNVTGVALAAGTLPFSLIGWEQAGAFINELSWKRPGTDDFEVIDDTYLRKPMEAIPEPASLLVWLGVAGLWSFAVRRRGR